MLEGKAKGNSASLQVTYNPSFKNLSFLICDNLHLLHSDPEANGMFNLAFFISFQSAKNLRAFFIGSNVYPLESEINYSKCNIKCH